MPEQGEAMRTTTFAIDDGRIPPRCTCDDPTVQRECPCYEPATEKWMEPWCRYNYTSRGQIFDACMRPGVLVLGTTP